jgi:FAD/FMN-containing dehydrogenase
VEALTLVDATGGVRRVSRSENADLFRLVVGGYGLFGVITSVQLRLAPRQKLRRLVTIEQASDVMQRFDSRIAEGCTWGDFQFMTDETSPGFLARGVCSCDLPVPDDTPIDDEPRELGEAEWRELYRLAHVDRPRLYDVYAGFYLATDGQVYWSDRHQLSVYLDGYHAEVDRAMGAATPGSEMISELYVPRPALAAFLSRVAEDFRAHGTQLIYGTVRLIEQDDETLLAWAREPWACIVFNLCVRHDAAGLARAGEEFRRLIDRAIEFGGSYFLTYHRWATREQRERCHPRLGEFLARKLEYDPGELFQSDWYRALIGDMAGG